MRNDATSSDGEGERLNARIEEFDLERLVGPREHERRHRRSARDVTEPLIELPSFNAYVVDIAGRCVAPPAVIRIDADLLESYGLA